MASITTSNLPYVQCKDGESEVKLASMSVRVIITGVLSETRVEMVFQNDNDRILEGELVLPLPESGVVSNYALDIDGELVEGVCVAKKEARRILEAEIRKGADPGLIEQAVGNVYRTRLYPIPAKGNRTVAVTFHTPLTLSAEGAMYKLPLTGLSCNVEVSLEVCQTPVSPKLNGGFAGLALTQESEIRWIANASNGTGSGNEDMTVALEGMPDQFVSLDSVDESVYFYGLTAKPAAGGADTPDASVDKITVLWDGSDSRGQGLEESNKACLRAICASVCAATPCEVKVQVFRNDLGESASFNIPTDNDALFKFVDEIDYDGGTNLACCASGLSGEEDCVLLFTDGMHTLDLLDGRTALPQFPNAARVFCVKNGPTCNRGMLDIIAEGTRGLVFDLDVQSPEEVSTTLNKAMSGPVIRARLINGNGNVYLRDLGAWIEVCGKIEKRPGTKLVIEGNTGVIREFGVDGSGASVRARVRDSVLAKHWANQHSKRLDVGGGNNAAQELLNLGNQYCIVTAKTSILVLETLDQHLEHNIEPSETRPRMREDYLARVESKQKSNQSTVDSHIKEVIKLWKTRQEWYETDFAAKIKAELELRAKSAEKSSLKSLSMSSVQSVDECMDIGMAAPPPGGAPLPGGAPIASAPMSRSAPAPVMASAAPMMMNFSRPAAMAAPPVAMEASRRSSLGRSMKLEEEDEKKEASSSVPTSGAITIKSWTPDAAYLTNIAKNKEEKSRYQAYLKEKTEYRNSPAFYLDCADWFLTQGYSDLGVRILSNLSETGLDSAQMKRMQSYRLLQEGRTELAIAILQSVLRERDDEPQSMRDLALALDKQWQMTKNAEDAQRACDLLWQVISKQWSNFPEIEVIALVEFNRIISFAQPAQLPDERLKVGGEWHSLIASPVEMDVRISMAWNTDLTDIDLHVYEPGELGEHCCYSHNRTKIGGLVSRDFTQGYGPEEYCLKKAQPGDYTIKAHYYGSSQAKVAGHTSVIVSVFTNYARAGSEKCQVMTLRLEKSGEQVEVGKITIDK